jgi:hypothetical protein
MNYSLTTHSAQRMIERDITHLMIDAALRIGSAIQKQKHDMIFVREKDIPSSMDPIMAHAINGLVLIMSYDGIIKTLYRNPKKGFRNIKKKSKRARQFWNDQSAEFNTAA